MIDKTIDLLGYKATDKVTGFAGVITSVCFDLYGCVQAALTPPAIDNEQKDNGRWFDTNRLNVSDEQVMQAPDFASRADHPTEYTQGAADKPCPR